ncbi:hypothetical protein F5Y17DRAFT_358680 [Xylariaceae sp. FL0594]|nr:hypothetical protein F5Y17DRAFT_358680 [Xylariaceae sp. FL0594]
MTERRLIEAVVGQAGRLSHVPYGTDKAGDHGWYSSRIFSLNALSSARPWIPAEPGAASDTLPVPGTPWDRSRKQRKWLLKSYPEASLGNHVLEDHLFDDDAVALQDGRCHQSCLFSYGELTDTTSGRARGAPLVVAVTGSARNVLQLAKLEQDTWTWSKEYPVAVRLAEMPTEKPALWLGEDAGPIRRVKCLTDLKRYNPTRWLAVQRDAGTTILQPEYRRPAADDNIERNSSPIAANPLFHLAKDQTGGSAHSDVAFNPGTRSNPPQIGLVDERGFWSVWDVTHTRFRPSGEPVCKLKMCGHISRGILDNSPYQDRSGTRWHKLLWVGRSEGDLDILGSLQLGADVDDADSQASFPPLHRSSFLLIYNSQNVRLFDLATGFHLPDLAFVGQDGRDCVLDVQRSHDPQYFYVLTTSKLFVVRAYSQPGVEWDKPEKVWIILFSTPHFRSPFDQTLQLCISQGVRSGMPTSLVSIYSSTNRWIDLFSVELSTTDPNAIRCQPNVPGLGSLHNRIASPVRAMWINPAPVTTKMVDSHVPIVRDFAEQRIRLFQVLVMKPDLSVVSFLCLSSSSSSVHVSPPTIRASRRPRAVRQRRVMRQPSPNFVVPDNLTVVANTIPRVTQRYVKVFYDRLCSIFASQPEESRSNRGLMVRNPFDVAHRSIDDALEKGLVPLLTLFEVMPRFREMSPDSLASVEWEAEIEKLDNAQLTLTVYRFDLMRSLVGLPASALLRDAYMRLLDIAKSSFDSRSVGQSDRSYVARITGEIDYDLHVSVYGIGRYIPRNNTSQAATDGKNFLLGSQADTLPSSPPRLASPPRSPPTWSQASDVEASEDEDPAMVLLRGYTGTGKFVPRKDFELLDKWDLGAEPSSYAFDLDRSGDAEAARQRRAKLLAREERKRRRASTLLHLSQEPELPATQPAPDIRFHSSQPRGFSSQRQILHSDPVQTMSQPAAGIFGSRPTKKAKKRKGGF